MIYALQMMFNPVTHALLVAVPLQSYDFLVTLIVREEKQINIVFNLNSLTLRHIQQRQLTVCLLFVSQIKHPAQTVYVHIHTRATYIFELLPSPTWKTQVSIQRCFSYEDIRKCTNNFSEVNGIGSGGYGKVYRGTLPSGMLVAIKRAEQGPMQGGNEFNTEIELLSRVHHRNVVSLIGFCFDQSEQMLVYEYIANGTLKESLSGI